MYNVLRLTVQQVPISIQPRRPCNTVFTVNIEKQTWPKNRKKENRQGHIIIINQCEKTQGTKDELHKPHKKPRE